MAILIKGMEMPKNCPCELVGVGYDLYCSFAYGIPARVREYDECCEKKTRPDWCPLVEVPGSDKNEPQTNADRIGSMTDEEMANKFSGQCPAIFGGTRMSGEECAGFESCQDCWLDWLKQEEE